MPSSNPQGGKQVEKAGWPKAVWIGLAGRPYLSKSPSVLGESGPIARRYVPASAVTGLVEALERSLEVLGNGGECPENQCGGCKYETAEVRAELRAALSAYKQETGA
jgi:hypothetical protein